MEPLAGQYSLLIRQNELLENLFQARPQAVSVDLPVGDSTFWRLTLTLSEVLTPEVRLVLGTDQGDVPIDAPRVHSYAGSVKGKPGSVVSLHVTSSEVWASIRLDGREYILGAREEDSDIYVLYPADADDDGLPLRCGVSGEDLTHAIRTAMSDLDAGFGKSRSTSMTPIEVQLAIEADYETYASFAGDAGAASEYLILLVSAVSHLFEDEINVRLTVPFIRIWSTPDDPYSGNDTGLLLEQVSTHWTSEMAHVARDLVHFVTPRQGNWGGMAFLDVLCTGAGYAVSHLDLGTPVSRLPVSGNLIVVAHELGHNFGSPHTHNCNWPGGPIDVCETVEGSCYAGPEIRIAGTLMSYCSSYPNTFGALPRNLMRLRAESVSCSSSTVETVTVQFRLDQNSIVPSLSAGDRVGIRANRPPLPSHVTQHFLSDPDGDGILHADVVFDPAEIGRLLAYKFVIERVDGTTQWEDVVGDAEIFVWTGDSWLLETGCRAFLIQSNAVLETAMFDGNLAMSPPLLRHPANDGGVSPLDVSFEWNPVPEADFYWLQVTTDVDFAESAMLVDNRRIDGEIYRTSLEPLTRYYWRVRAGMDAGWSTWSNPWSISTLSEGDDGDSPSEASELQIGDSVAFSLNANSDVDYFRFTLTPTDTVEIALREAAPNSFCILQLFSEDGQVYRQEFKSADVRAVRVAFSNPSGGTFYLRIASFWDVFPAGIAHTGAVATPLPFMAETPPSGSSGVGPDVFVLDLRRFHPGAPAVSGSWLKTMSANNATVDVWVHPFGSPTSVSVTYQTTTGDINQAMSPVVFGGIDPQQFTVTLDGLMPATIYSYHAAAANAYGTTLTRDVAFALPDPSPFWDHSDGTHYLTDVHVVDRRRVVAAGAGDAVLLSRDGGDTWTAVKTGAWSILNRIAFADTRRGWIVGTQGLIIRTEDAGDSWSVQRTGTEELRSVAFAGHEHGVTVGAQGTILVTTDGGETWVDRPSGTTARLNGVSLADQRTGYIAGDGRTLLKTDDGGISWINLQDALPSETGDLLAVHFVDSTTGFVAAGQINLLRTSDGGRSWSRVWNRARTITDFSFTGADHGFASTIDGNLLSTSDGGINWALESSGATVYVNGLAMLSADYGTAVGQTNMLRKRSDALPDAVTLVAPSEDAGDQPTSTTLSWLPETTADYYLVQVEATASDDMTIVDTLVSVPTMIAGPLESGTTYVWRIKAGNALGWGPWSENRSFSTASATGAVAISTLPTSLELSQNYPNPFNPATIIQFGLPMAGAVTLDVFDVLGRRVTTLYDRELSPGRYTFTFDASGLPSGLYVYRLQSGGETAKRLMLLAK